MMIEITVKQMKEGCDKAYKKAGHNAYFGNGFEAGVEFALEVVKKSTKPDWDSLKNQGLDNKLTKW